MAGSGKKKKIIFDLHTDAKLDFFGWAQSVRDVKSPPWVKLANACETSLT
jgi:hypothetical protein